MYSGWPVITLPAGIKGAHSGVRMLHWLLPLGNPDVTLISLLLIQSETLESNVLSVLETNVTSGY